VQHDAPETPTQTTHALQEPNKAGHVYVEQSAALTVETRKVENERGVFSEKGKPLFYILSR
jgi:hypothetical protein